MKKKTYYIVKILIILSCFFAIFTSPLKTYAENEMNFSWEAMANLPDNRAGAAAVTFDGKIYLFGGSSGTATGAATGVINNTTYVYDPVQNQWSLKSPMPTPRSAVSAIALNNKIYLIGGYTRISGTMVRLSTVEIYDPTTDTWTSGTNLSSTRAWVGLGVYNEKIYAFGGLNENSGKINTFEVFDPITSKWSSKQTMPFPGGAIGVTYFNQKFYIIGHADNSFWEFDPEKIVWKSLSSSPYKVEAANLIVNNNEIYATNNFENDLIQKYNPLADAWSTPFSLSSFKFQTQSVVLAGDIYVIGGANNQLGGITSSFEKLIIQIKNQEQGRALLVITLLNGMEKEYDLSMEDVNAFVKWLDEKHQGIGPAKYEFDKYWNKGPFKARTDFIIFDRILTFEINEY
jgi:N-acetylneuraminic acid mutarotase